MNESLSVREECSVEKDKKREHTDKKTKMTDSFIIPYGANHKAGIKGTTWPKDEGHLTIMAICGHSLILCECNARSMKICCRI